MKTCIKCNKTKDLSEFNKHKLMADGHLNQCKQCVKERKADYYIREKDKISKRLKYNYEANKEDRISKMKSYYKEHKEDIIEQHREYVKNNKDAVREREKIWRNNNRYKVNKQANIRWKRRRAKKQEIDENYTKADDEYTRSLFNNQCACCGSTDNLCIDHHYPLSKGHALSRDNAVLLCNSCNCSKSNKMPEDFYSPEQLKFITETLNTPLTIR